MQQYVFEEQIQTTLFGAIYRAKAENGSKVAIKLSDLSHGITHGKENPKNEVLLMKKLSSSGLDGKQYILKLLDNFYFKHEGISYYCSVTEFAQEDLLERIQYLAAKGRQMSFQAIHHCFRQIVEGVCFLHRSGISHLDLSLENILLKNDTEVKICDFGQAENRRFFEPQRELKGKFHYMAPEVYGHRGFDGYKADVWSVGVILWALLTGSLLYQRPNQMDANFRKLTKGKPGIEALLRANRVFDVPAGVIDLIAGMLSIRLDARFSIEQVLRHPWVQSEFEGKQKLKISHSSSDSVLYSNLKSRK
jgi:serine/threonine protein kinase